MPVELSFDEKDLLQRLITGDEGAFHLFYENYALALTGLPLPPY